MKFASSSLYDPANTFTSAWVATCGINSFLKLFSLLEINSLAAFKIFSADL